ncbi:MAG: hypothetical protein OXE87_05865 [Chloroflexi bacterium]|nr:hypothetical protein [Chloroflexota bacterium]
MATADTDQTVRINRQVKAHLDAADRELMVSDTVKSSAELGAAVRLAAVLTLKHRGLPHETDSDIFESIKVLDEQEKAKGAILLKYGAASSFRDNASHDYMELEEFLFCRPAATEFADCMQDLLDGATQC